MNPSHLRSLAERVSGAAGADREIDRDVFELTVVGKGRLAGDEKSILATEARYGGGWLAHIHPFSASLDAATSVFPPGTMYRSGHDGNGPDPSLFFCEAITDVPECHRVRTAADTETLARLAAALLARATLADQERSR